MSNVVGAELELWPPAPGPQGIVSGLWHSMLRPVPEVLDLVVDAAAALSALIARAVAASLPAAVHTAWRHL
jgi:hypothetical protein